MTTSDKRVVFTFDDLSFHTLAQMTAEGQYSSMGDCVRESLQITRAISQEAQRGFSELRVRNPRTGAERTLVIPRLALLAGR